MNKLLVPALLFATIFSLSVSVCAQDDDLDYTGKINRTYDTARNLSEIEIRRIPVAAGKVSLSELGLTFNHPGKTLTSKPEFLLFILSIVNTKGHRYPDQNKITFSSGGNEIAGIVILNLDQREFSATQTLETLGVKMPIRIFQKLAASKQAVMFKLAETTLTIDAAAIGKFAEFEKAITP